MNKNRLTCPICHQGELKLKYEAEYVYSYIIDSDSPGLKNDTEFYPFLYDNREQKKSAQYIECDVCKMRHTCIFSIGINQINVSDLQTVIDSICESHSNKTIMIDEFTS